MGLNQATPQQQLRGASHHWTSVNPTLKAGEIGYETDTGLLKIGDGVTAWTGLSYFVGAGGSGTVTSVGQTVPTGFTVSGSPVTTSGTLAIAYDTGYQGYTTTEAGKLSGIEALADVTDATNVDAAGAVMNADYDANTILAATSDNTPVALTVAEQTLVGRITSGAIDSLTVTEVKTLLTDRLEEDATVTGTKNIDWTAYETFYYTLTGACTFSDTNLPASGSKTITVHMKGDFAPTYPSGWSTYISGTYDTTGTVAATGTVTCVSAIATDTVTVNGLTYTGVTGTKADNTEFSVDTSDTACATDLADSITNDARSGTLNDTTATSSVGVVTITQTVAGISGNATTLSSSNGTRLAVSGSTFTGGDAVLNIIVAEYVKAGTPFYKIQISQPD